ncbi:MAG: SagB family peptide dehydrogenase [Deltaproteobacteria bacterium]|nr:SagB family peptide dehydrogenase [Deltaproteobacteria bacterium]
MTLQYTVTFRPDAIVKQGARGPILETSFGTLNLSNLEAALPGVIERIVSGVHDEDTLSGLVMSEKGMKGLSIFDRWWRMLLGRSYISYTLRRDDRPLARLNPLGFGLEFNQNPVSGDDPWVLSRFALLRRKGETMLLECPKGWAEIVLMDPRLSGLLFALARPCSPAELAGKTGLTEDEVRAFLNMLRCAKAVCALADDGMPDEEHQRALAHWDVHDLYFHSRSRMGRHANGWATTYRFKGRFSPISQIKDSMSDTVISLTSPDVEALCKGDDAVPFFEVLENRASRREYADTPINVEQLGAFLYHAFRVKKKYDDELGGVTFRPTPGGGALHSLELYVLVDACDGLERGFYRYNPMVHQLEKVSDPTPHTDQMLFLGRQMMLNKTKSQIEIVFASRFQRIQWKYESIAYSVILKDVGCLYQTMYLVAEAMGLAGVALGGGDADLFAAATRLDYFDEGSVGAFMLGSRKPAEQSYTEKEVCDEKK